LDSNILVKLVLNEVGSKEARASVADALKKGYALHTVDIALAEGLNVIWKHANMLKDLKMKEAMPATEDLTRVYDGLNIVTAREIAAEAVKIALAQNITVYDSLYIAAAQKLKAILYTADRKLWVTAKKIINARMLKTKA
jgi:predicted nucleic acid-binding protein